MSEEQIIQLRFANEAEQIRYSQLRLEPSLKEVFHFGHTMACDYMLPRIADGRATYKKGELERQVKGYLKAGLEDLASHFGRKVTDDERFMFRVGYDSAVLPAKEEAERLMQAGEKLAEAFALAAASIEATNSALRMLDGPLSENAPPTPAPHILALATRPPRPLRPEDFGALPQPQ